MQFSRVHRTPASLAHRLAGAALACIGTVALASSAHAKAVTFDYTGADVMYTINPGTYRITVYGAQGGSTQGSSGGVGAEASAIYKIGQTLNLRIGVGGQAPLAQIAAGGGGASFVDFAAGSGGFNIGVLLLVGGGGGGAYNDINTFTANGGDGKATSTDPGANGLGRGGGGGGGYQNDGQSDISGGEGGDNLLNGGGVPGKQQSPGGFGGGGGGATGPGINSGNGGGGGGGYNGGDGGYDIFGHPSQFFASQGGTSYANDNPFGCDPDEPSPACFVGGLVLATGAQVEGEGLGNGSVIIEPVTGLAAVPEPPAWLLMISAIPFIGLLRFRGRRQVGLSATIGSFRFMGS
jgi:hypothetical protein